MKDMKTCCKGYKVMIELVKKELIYDIKNTAFIFADSYSDPNVDAKQLKNVFDVSEEGNMDKLARILDSAVEDCREMLSALRNWKCWVVALILTSGQSASVHLPMRKKIITW